MGLGFRVPGFVLGFRVFTIRHRVIDTYAEVRRLSDQSGGIPIAVRHIESIIRIAEAHAKVSVAVRFETAFCVVLRIENSVV